MFFWGGGSVQRELDHEWKGVCCGQQNGAVVDVGVQLLTMKIIWGLILGSSVKQAASLDESTGWTAVHHGQQHTHNLTSSWSPYSRFSTES